MTLEDTRNVTSSPGSQDGAWHCNSLDGQQIEKSGQEAVHVSHTHQPEREKGIATRETCGPTSSVLSASAALSASLASKLKTRLATVGSMEYRQTWKEKATPSGRLYWAHTARARRTSDSGCSGEVSVSDLQMVAKLTGWNTPRATDGTKNGRTDEGVAKELERRGRCDDLTMQAKLTGWATPAARDFKSGQTADGQPLTYNARPLSEQALGATTTSSPAATTKPAASVLNPAMSRWLQGFPATWDEASPNYDEWRSVQQELIALAV